MIEIGPDEALFLKTEFADFTDRNIIRELVRRGRLREYESSVTFYKEMRGEDRYMDMVRHGLLHVVAKQIDDDKGQRPAMIAERPEPIDPLYQKSILTASLVTLVARAPKEG